MNSNLKKQGIIIIFKYFYTSLVRFKVLIGLLIRTISYLEVCKHEGLKDGRMQAEWIKNTAVADLKPRKAQADGDPSKKIQENAKYKEKVPRKKVGVNGR